MGKKLRDGLIHLAAKYNPTAMSYRLTLLCAKIERIDEIFKRINKKVLPTER